MKSQSRFDFYAHDQEAGQTIEGIALLQRFSMHFYTNHSEATAPRGPFGAGTSQIFAPVQRALLA